MRLTKMIWLLCLSSLVFMMTGCQKDSVQPQTTPPPSHQSKKIVAKQSEDKKTAAMQKENKVQTSVPKVSPAKTTNTAAKKETTQTKNVTPKPASPTPTPQSAAITATVQVVGYQGKGILSVTKVPIKQGDTVLSATQSILKMRGIPISVKGSGATAYVEGIDNEFEFDHGPTSGWMVYLNGKEMSESAGAVAVKKDDHIVWKYTTELKGAGG